MEKLLKYLDLLLPILPFYPRWAQTVFVLTFALVLSSMFIFIVLYPSASKMKSNIATQNKNLAAVSFKSLKPEYIEAFNAFEDEKPDDLKRLFGGSLIFGEENSWIGAITNGTYRLINTTNKEDIKYFYIGLAGKDLSEAAISVEVKVDLIEGATSFSGAGLLYRFDRNTRFYYALILHADQSYTFYSRNASGIKDIYSGRSDSIRPREYNKLAIVGCGSQLGIYINDDLAQTVEDTEHKSGDVGIIAMSTGMFLFDNFAIYK